MIVTLTSLEFVKGFALLTLAPAVDHIWEKLISLHIPMAISPGHLVPDHTAQPALKTRFVGDERPRAGNNKHDGVWA